MVAATESQRLHPRTYEPTLWGLTTTSLHDRFWAAQGVCVVRRGEATNFDPAPKIYLLTDVKSLVLFKMPVPVSLLVWTGPKLAVARIHHEKHPHMRETITSNAEHRFVRIERETEQPREHLSRVAITTSRQVAEMWQASADATRAWRLVRKEAGRRGSFPRIIFGQVYNRNDPRHADAFARGLMAYWNSPGTSINGVERMNSEVWKPVDATVDTAAQIVGSVWIGAGRAISADAVIAGPAVLWDDSDAAEAPKRPAGPRRLRATSWVEQPPVIRRRSRAERAVKRGFDMLFATLALAVTVPFYPIIMLAIWLEDGRPFFFCHRRETMREREFNCCKFRSMRKDAELLKFHLRRSNVSNGPHFHVPDDPRVTRAGRWLRRFHLDELPQFWNVLIGHMSVVGPRPSPHCENQGSTSWREARLSVRPGITGLWQVMRTREAGVDFQEWVRYDVQYVETGGLWMDLRIILRTIRLVMFPL